MNQAVKAGSIKSYLIRNLTKFGHIEDTGQKLKILVENSMLSDDVR